MGKRKWQGILVIVLTIVICWTLMGIGGQTGYYSPLWVLPLYLAGLMYGVILLIAGRKKASE